MRISDQSSAIKLAICDDIGEKSYDATDVGAILVQILSKLPTVGKSCVFFVYRYLILNPHLKPRRYTGNNGLTLEFLKP